MVGAMLCTASWRCASGPALYQSRKSADPVYTGSLGLAEILRGRPWEYIKAGGVVLYVQILTWVLSLIHIYLNSKGTVNWKWIKASLKWPHSSTCGWEERPPCWHKGSPSTLHFRSWHSCVGYLCAIEIQSAQCGDQRGWVAAICRECLSFFPGSHSDIEQALKHLTFAFKVSGCSSYM
jgi:hypothetical protein